MAERFARRFHTYTPQDAIILHSQRNSRYYPKHYKIQIAWFINKRKTIQIIIFFLLFSHRPLELRH